jgi:hypothetical protein
MQISHIGRFTLIFTAKRLPIGWQGCARVKPFEGAPEPFNSSPVYLTQSTFRSEQAAEAGAQKEVKLRMQKGVEERRALDSLVAESKMRVTDDWDNAADDVLG